MTSENDKEIKKPLPEGMGRSTASAIRFVYQTVAATVCAIAVYGVSATFNLWKDESAPRSKFDVLTTGAELWMNDTRLYGDALELDLATTLAQRHSS